MGPLAKGISSIIGLSTEAVEHHKQKKAAATSASQPSHSEFQPTEAGLIISEAPGPSSVDPASTLAVPEGEASTSRIRSGSASRSGYESYDDEDEDDWVCDETAFELSNYQAAKAQPGNVSEPQSMELILQDFTRAHPPSAYNFALSHKLAAPVIIPQRRPGSKHRGFVQAYAPALNDCGIDEKTFTDFRTDSRNLLKLALAVSVLAETIAVAPSVIVHETEFAVHTSIEAGRRLYITNQQNKYLDGINEAFFKPHGLYAMIMTWKPSSSSSTAIEETVDLNTNIVQSVHARQGGGGSKFRTSSGKTIGQAQMPSSLPLIFPGLQAASEEQKKNAFKKAGHFIAEFEDRKSQAKFANQNPDSTLAASQMQTKEFSSRWADPNSAANSGGLVAVLSGGYLGRQARRQKRNQMMGRGDVAVNGNLRQRQGLIGTVRRKLGENVLYLMIVNMPTEEEMKEAVALSNRMKSE